MRYKGLIIANVDSLLALRVGMFIYRDEYHIHFKYCSIVAAVYPIIKLLRSVMIAALGHIRSNSHLYWFMLVTHLL